MSNGKDAPAEEILIIRRRHGEGEEGHHGGVWKIAYADFMTAMMAFFLVMWLINAANTETKASVASYFNPIKLTDNVSRKKGLKEIDEKANAGEKSEREKPQSKGDPSKKNPDATSKDKQGASSGAPDRSSSATQSEGGAGAFGDATEAGTAFRDPFNPFAHNQYLMKERTPREATEQRPAPSEPGAEDNRKDAKGGEDARLAGRQGDPDDLRQMADRVKREAERAVHQLGITGGPGLDVKIEGESVVLSLTDTSTFGMFAVGSADPNADLVRLIGAIAPSLAANSESLILRGHTDARPFRNEKGNNNWRLAMSRAEAAYFMLLRAGIEESRFERIEAHADRKLKLAREPEAAANRRIEIMLRRAVPR